MIWYVLVSEIPNESFLSHVGAISYCYHEDWRTVRGELLDLVIREDLTSGDFIHGLYIQDLGFGLPCVGLLVSWIPSLFDVLGVELLKLVLYYLGLGILCGCDPVLYGIMFIGLFLVYNGEYSRARFWDWESRTIFFVGPMSIISHDGPLFVCFGRVYVCVYCGYLQCVVLFFGV